MAHGPNKIVALALFAAALAGARGAAVAAEPGFSVRLEKPVYRNTLFSTMPDRRIVVCRGEDPTGQTNGPVSVQLRTGEKDELLAEGPLAAVGDRYTFDAAKLRLKAGTYRLLCDAASPRGGTPLELPLTILSPNGKGNEVWFDGDGICHVNGRPFYPIGLYHLEDHIDNVNRQQAAAGKPGVTYDQMYRRAKAHGFNTAVVFPIDWEREDPFMELAARHGLMQIRYVWGSLDNGQFDERIKRFRQHPNLLAWSTMDEPKEEWMHVVMERDWQRLRGGLDPYHPVQVAQCYSDWFGRTAATCDLPSPDIYPLYPAGTDPWWQKLPGWQPQWKASLRLVSMYLEYMRAAIGPHRPLWQIVQGSGGEKPILVPTPEQYRNLVYQGVCAGVRGTLVYAYTCPDATVNGQQYWVEQAPELWESMGKVNQELRELEPFLLAPGGTFYRCHAAPDLRILARQVGHRVCLLAVNIGESPQNLTLDLGPEWKELREKWTHGSVPLTNGQLHAAFAPFSVKVYEGLTTTTAPIKP